jgi:hypothetical protein
VLKSRNRAIDTEQALATPSSSDDRSDKPNLARRSVTETWVNIDDDRAGRA